MTEETHGFPVPHVQRYMLTGVLVLAPLWVTWLVFEFLLEQLSRLGRPWVQAFAALFHGVAPGVSAWLLQPWFESAIAILLTLVGLYLLGWTATRVVGKRVIAAFEALMERIPLVQAIYGATKKLLAAFRKKPGRMQRVVLINFPSRDMKAVGFVTRTIRDATTGQELAVIYVPTSPNPTSGYMEIVPVDQVVETDWTMDEAMGFVITGGTTGPESVHFTRGA